MEIWISFGKASTELYRIYRSVFLLRTANVEALDSIDLNLQDGEFPVSSTFGSGKSTAAQILADVLYRLQDAS
jgi:ABC-type dipeptide/oligopeptide/nickel transport system ATPase subunit